MAEANASTMPAGDDPAASLSGTVTITEAAPKQGTPEHAAWVKAQGEKAPAAQVPTMPDNGVEKFYNKETGAYDWANHVKELNYRLEQGRKPQEQKPAEQPPPQGQPQDDPNAAAQEAAKAAGLDWDTLETKVNSTGKLEQSDYDAFEKAGIPKRFVDNYMQALTIARQAVVNEVIAHAGGQDELNGLIQWAAANLPADKKTEFNSVLASDQWRIAIDGLKDARAKALGTGEEPNLLHGQNTASTGVGFQSPEEMSAAINARNDKGQRKYDVDPAYRKTVREKIAASAFDPTRMQ